MKIQMKNSILLFIFALFLLGCPASTVIREDPSTNEPPKKENPAYNRTEETDDLSGNMKFADAETKAKRNWTKLLLLETSIIRKQERLEIAKGLLSDIEQLNAYIPSVPPDDKRWLENELQALRLLKGNARGKKLDSIMTNPVFHKNRIKSMTQEIIVELELAQIEDSEPAEILAWAWVSYLLTNRDLFNESIAFLNESRQVDFSKSIRDQLGLGIYDAWFGYNLIGREIQERIVIPYLAGLIK